MKAQSQTNLTTRRKFIKAATVLTASLSAGTSEGVEAELKNQKEYIMKEQYDVLVIGGGPAGLSASLALGRMRRTALVCDDNRPRNAPSMHMHNFPTRDGINPASWREEAKKDVQKYPTVEFFSGSVVNVTRTPAGGFMAELSSGSKVAFRKVILADGITDRFPAILGVKELWGKSVFHCPYCHGYEIRDTAVGLVGNGDMAMHVLLLVTALSKDVIFFTNGGANLTGEQKDLLSRKGIVLDERKIVTLESEGESLTGLRMEDGKKVLRQALFIAPVLPFRPKSDLGEKLGCERTEMGLYKVSPKNETTAKGVFAAGDNMTTSQSVMSGCANGATAASAAIYELVMEDE
ncbi:MAG: NAD(P)/FAD-dependent oxidoreductase [Luteolibacter sp.]